jgi:hypothetical protein
VKPSSASIGFTSDQVKALEETRRKLNFTPEEAEEHLRRSQADLGRLAATDTPEEQRRIGAQVWAERIERPRAARRIQAARRVRRSGHQSRPTRPRRVVVKRRVRAARTTTPSRGDPDDDPDESSEETWALTFVDRAPVLWRFRAARCRLLEAREAIRMGVDR